MQTVSFSVGPSCQHLGRGGGREQGGRENWVSLSSLCAPILFSGFPFYEEIVASHVTLPFKGEGGKRACVFQYEGIHNPPPQIPQTTPMTHTAATSRRGTLLKLARPWFCAHLEQQPGKNHCSKMKPLKRVCESATSARRALCVPCHAVH